MQILGGDDPIYHCHQQRLPTWACCEVEVLVIDFVLLSSTSASLIALCTVVPNSNDPREVVGHCFCRRFFLVYHAIINVATYSCFCCLVPSWFLVYLHYFSYLRSVTNSILYFGRVLPTASSLLKLWGLGFRSSFKFSIDSRFWGINKLRLEVQRVTSLMEMGFCFRESSHVAPIALGWSLFLIRGAWRYFTINFSTFCRYMKLQCLDTKRP